MDMDPVLAEIYSTVFEAAPYVIGAYVLMWLVLAVFVILSANSLKRVEKQVAALEEAVRQLGD
jgi:heme exporter protein CcmD